MSTVVQMVGAVPLGGGLGATLASAASRLTALQFRMTRLPAAAQVRLRTRADSLSALIRNEMGRGRTEAPATVELGLQTLEREIAVAESEVGVAPPTPGKPTGIPPTTGKPPPTGVRPPTGPLFIPPAQPVLFGLTPLGLVVVGVGAALAVAVVLRLT